MRKKPSPYRSGVPIVESQSPFRLLIVVVFSIVVCETVVMIILSALPPFSTYPEALLDSTLLLILLSPVLYFWLFRPHIVHMTERKRAEEALAESEKKYRGLVDNALVGVYKTNLKGEVLYANDAARKIFEYDSVEEMISEGALARYKNPEDRKVFIDTLKKSGELDNFESEMVTKTGKITHVLLSATLDGETLSGMVMDVTERKRTEEALRNVSDAVSSVTGESFFRELVVSLATTLNVDTAYVGELSGDTGRMVRTTAVSSGGKIVDNFEYDLAETPCEDVEGDALCCCFPSGVQKLFPRDRFLSESEAEGYMGSLLRDSDGKTVGVLVVLSRTPVENPELAESMLRIFAVRASAEMERKRSEEALRNISDAVSSVTGESFFRVLVQSLARTLNTDIAFIGELCGDSGEKVRSIAACCDGDIVDNVEYDLAGTPCENVIGKKLCYYPRGVQKLFPKDRMLVDMGIDGYMGCPLFDSAGRPMGILVVLHRKPIEEGEHAESMLRIFAVRASAEMERKRSEEALKVSEGRLRDAQRMEMIGNLAAGVAHEVRNPLTTIMATTDALLRDFASDAEYRPYLIDMRSQANRLSKLMRDLLEFGKTVEPSCIEPVPLSEVCTSAVELCKQLPFEKEFKVRLDLREGPEPVEVLAQGDRLEQVFQNLLENAVHHSPDGGEIDLVIEAPRDGMCTVRIVDRGPGVPEDVLAFVFDPFFSTRRGGTGLGLSIVKNIVESFGGGVVLSNNASGPGCVVEVTLPVAESEKR